MEAPPRARGLGRSGPRRRSGCTTCRARKVRCDEAKPACANCVRLRLGCVYKTIVPFTVPRRTGERTTVTTFSPDPATNINANPPNRPDVNFFSTVLRFDDQRRQHHQEQQQQQQQQQIIDVPPLRPMNDVADFPGSFDMLGFIGEITSELEQKHLDLTNGVSDFTDLMSPLTATDTVGGHDNSETPSTVSGTQSQSPPNGGIWPEMKAAYEEQLLAYFRDVEPPSTIFGSVNLEWKYVRETIVACSHDFRPLRNSIYCFADIHKASKEGKRWKLAPTYYQQASSDIQSSILGNVGESILKRVFTTVFLLMLSESLSSPELWRHGTSFLHSAYLLLQRFHGQTKHWTGFGHLVVSWVSLLDVKSLIAGREGDPLIELGSLAEPVARHSEVNGSGLGRSYRRNGTTTVGEGGDRTDTEDDLLSKPGYLVYDAIVGPAFRFFVKAKQVIRRIICIDLHHRSRGTLSDEFEVLQIAHKVGADLETLWNCRPPVLDVYNRPEELLDTLSQPVAIEVCRTLRQYVANFLAIFVYLHRVAFAIYPRTDRVFRAVDQIIQLASAESASVKRHLPAGFFWPLFVAGLEGSLDQRLWVLQEMQRMAASNNEVVERHPNAAKVLLLVEEMTRRQDASGTWADSKCVRRELFTDFFVMI